MTLTREGLEEALKLAGAATEGPWTVELSVNGHRVFVTTTDEDQEFDVGRSVLDGGIVEQNAAFIAFSREAVPAMAQALLRGLEAIEEWWCDDSTGHEVDEAVNAVLGRVRAARAFAVDPAGVHRVDRYAAYRRPGACGVSGTCPGGASVFEVGSGHARERAPRANSLTNPTPQSGGRSCLTR